MSEKKPSQQELTQRIDEVLTVLKDISRDLVDISKALKTGVSSSGPAAPTPTPSTTGGTSSITAVRTLFPRELEEMLFFEDKGEYVEIRPKRFLGSENFAKIASIIRGAGGEYVSAGRESHFKAPKQV